MCLVGIHDNQPLCVGVSATGFAVVFQYTGGLPSHRSVFKDLKRAKLFLLTVESYAICVERVEYNLNNF